jgi:hypothetical protein
MRFFISVRQSVEVNSDIFALGKPTLASAKINIGPQNSLTGQKL